MLPECDNRRDEVADGTVMRILAAQDGERMFSPTGGQDWIVSWHPSLVPPEGTRMAPPVCVSPATTISC
jgi:hypothetical protein